MTDYAVMAKHSGFVDRFLKSSDLPESIGMRIWWAESDAEILRFRNRQSAIQLKESYELYFAAEGEPGYSFVVMKTVMVPEWRPA